MEIPVVIAHMNAAPYLKPVLATARSFNSRVILIGNQTNAELGSLAECVRFEPYAREAACFQKIYRHLSSNPHDFELFCFQRWFLLRDFLESRNLELCFAMDSDVLLYAHAGTEFARLFSPACPFTLLNGTSGGSSFFTRESLAHFCRFLRETYEDKSSLRFQLLTATFSEFQKARRPGGVCDMTLFRLFAQETHARFGEMCAVIDHSTYDRNINLSDGFEMLGPMKRIYARGGLPYGKALDSETFIQFKTLHFQGDAKQWLPDMAERILGLEEGS